MPAHLEPFDNLTKPSVRPAHFLQVPPFPGARVRNFALLSPLDDAPASLAECIALVRAKRVGGTYWGARPDLPPSYTLVRSVNALRSYDRLVKQYGTVLAWLATPSRVSLPCLVISEECDPWHMLGGAQALVCEADDDIRAIAAVLGIPTFVNDIDGGVWRERDGEIDAILSSALPITSQFEDPFGGRPMNLLDVIKLTSFWRSLIDSNRQIQSGIGFAFWKQDSVRPLLWGGGESGGFFHAQATADPGRAVAVWRSKASREMMEKLSRRGTPLIEVEDGFLRSKGLGADCVPPLSITVDRLGAYFDPGQPSELEDLLQHGEFEPALIARAQCLRKTIVAAGLGKYDRGADTLKRLDVDRRQILVPGQVEDDRSILTGGSGLVSNLELLKRVRALEPDAFLIYKPHPDVVAGHRKGHIPENISRQFADEVLTDGSISSLIATVDEVHVNTSLAGFEALMRFKDVTTHGVPFYAGWGLTHDLGPVPARRTARRSLDEIVAATLLLYPRYLDPVSGLPCPAEVVVDRLTAPSEQPTGALVRMRRLQGRLKRRLTAWRSA